MGKQTGSEGFYGLFMLYCAACMFLLLYSRRKLDRRTKLSLILMIFAMCAAVIAQALIPELLLTSAGITFVCLGIFVALDNPDKDMRQQALWDYATGLKNKNCYTRDVEVYAHRFGKKAIPSIAFVIADLNHLKLVNDTYGHVEGDAMIAADADALKQSLHSAQAIYRIGSDEFAAVYLAPDERVLQAEIEKVHAFCRGYTGLPVPLSIALGYAIGTGGGELSAVFERADRDMYEKKQRMKEAGLACARPKS